MTNLYPYRSSTTPTIAAEDDPRYETPGGAQNKVESYVSQTYNIGDKQVTQPKIADGAVGPDQLSPEVLQQYPEAAVVAKFIQVDEQLADIVINVKNFGAIGDGEVDDDDAIRAANLYGYNKARVPSVQTIPTNSMQIYIPAGIYRVRGNHVFGSPLAEGQSGTSPAIDFKLIGDNATIIWELTSASDELFYFDGTITMPQVSGITIIPVSENQSISIGGTIFKYFNNSTVLGYADASKGNYHNISVWNGRSTSNPNFTTKIKRVFHNKGYGMGDQTLVLNCRFWYFETLYLGENTESVNWTFDSCGLYGGGFTTSVYFHFTKMSDNFNVRNCSFSVSSSETLLKTDSEISGGFYTQSAVSNFNFDNNRIEIYGSSGTTWKLADMNFGRLNMRNANLRLASGASLVKTIVSAYGLANFNFENVVFNNVLFLLPIAIAPAITGGLSSLGAIFRYCDLLSTGYEIKYYDGTTQYNIKDVFVSALIFKSARFEECTHSNGNGTIDFDITNNQASVGTVRRIERTFNFSKGGIALGNTFSLPPFQTIKNIKIYVSAISSTFSAFRIYFGDKSIGNFIDVANPNPSTDIKSEFLLWEGIATIYYSDITLQSITVYVLNSGVETGAIRSQISVTCEPLDPLTFGLTTTADSIQIRTKVQNTSYGTTANRPTIGLYIGKKYDDTTLQKTITWWGSSWKDATGTVV
ncbi:hypothetical protein NYE80_24000 [Paenibacillus sp. FSL H7-0357]|uniref:hypothetical protein n=1 Tax=Paenibacillus sp. FSL H7-0357 TaxID=1536774 RepID=UPI00056FDEE8|nr:hypothetical protein [Paenibacillus sp. FSL H7-0357]